MVRCSVAFLFLLSVLVLVLVAWSTLNASWIFFNYAVKQMIRRQETEGCVVWCGVVSFGGDADTGVGGFAVYVVVGFCPYLTCCE